MTRRDIVEAALALPEEERRMIIGELEASLPGEDDDALVATINERVAAVEAGEPGIPAEQVFAELLAR